MQTATHHGKETTEGASNAGFVSLTVKPAPPLKRPAPPITSTASRKHCELGRASRVARFVPCDHGRLAWPVAELRRVLGVAA